VAVRSGAGSSASATIAGTDTNGIVSVTTGSSPTGASSIVNITFSTPFASAPKLVLVQAANSAAADVGAAIYCKAVNITVSAFTIDIGSVGLSASTVYQWSYLVIG
jgi:hypothetical protein